MRALIEHELTLIAELQYEPYFLTVHDLVAIRDAEGTSSARDAARPPIPSVCYCLGVTAVDPGRSRTCCSSASSPGSATSRPTSTSTSSTSGAKKSSSTSTTSTAAHRAAIAATVITYQPRSALRDVGKALGLDPLQVDAPGAGACTGGTAAQVADERVRERGLRSAQSAARSGCCELVHELIGFPRHLSQHVGGFVISRGPLEELVPIENATMPDRTVIQWDKDDLDALGLLKVDVLGLGHALGASANRSSCVRDFRGEDHTLASTSRPRIRPSTR